MKRKTLASGAALETLELLATRTAPIAGVVGWTDLTAPDMAERSRRPATRLRSWGETARRIYRLG
jgi:hypothetical protein